jgi:hypothetical protein
MDGGVDCECIPWKKAKPTISTRKPIMALTSNAGGRVVLVLSMGCSISKDSVRWGVPRRDISSLRCAHKQTYFLNFSMVHTVKTMCDHDQSMDPSSMTVVLANIF